MITLFSCRSSALEFFFFFSLENFQHKNMRNKINISQGTKISASSLSEIKIKSNVYVKKKIRGLVFATNWNEIQSTTFSKSMGSTFGSLYLVTSAPGAWCQQRDSGCPSRWPQAWLWIIRCYWRDTVALQIQTQSFCMGYQPCLRQSCLCALSPLFTACMRIALQEGMGVSANCYVKNIKQDYTINILQSIYLKNHLLFGNNIWFCSESLDKANRRIKY